MSLDIRLDFINKINPEFINKMTEIRNKFIVLDNELRKINDEMNGDSAGLRAIALARTHIETSCMYAIKSLCIAGEE